MLYLPVFALLWPLLLLAMLVAGGRVQHWGWRLLPLASVPALLLAAVPGLEIDLDWLLLGLRLGVDSVNAPLLLLTGINWTAAGWYSLGYFADRPGKTGYGLFYLLTYIGNLGVFLALDSVGLYLFFSILTFAAYGLIVHDGTAEARRAGRIYLILAVAGEILIMILVLRLAAAAGNADLRGLGAVLLTLPDRDWLILLTVIGFGIKMGILPLHVWLALAHPNAPTPASAVLSGVIVKAGLIGWLRFLPLGEAALPGWGSVFVIGGLTAAFYAVLVGLPQRRPKTVLAYSSISQMGLVSSLIGIGLLAPDHWPLILTIVLFFSVHHGLAKAALFLGVGVVPHLHRTVGWLIILPALALAAAPLTSGSLAKLLYKEAAHTAPPFWDHLLTVLLPFSSVATALLLVRFVYLLYQQPPHDRTRFSTTTPWLLLIGLGLLIPWVWAWLEHPEIISKSLYPENLLIGALTPTLIAVALGVCLGVIGHYLLARELIPEGDILSPVSRLLRQLPGIGEDSTRNRTPIVQRLGYFAVVLRFVEVQLRRWPVLGGLLIGLMVALTGLLRG